MTAPTRRTGPLAQSHWSWAADIRQQTQVSFVHRDRGERMEIAQFNGEGKRLHWIIAVEASEDAR